VFAISGLAPQGDTSKVAFGAGKRAFPICLPACIRANNFNFALV
jgi:hypothetical protein